MSHASRIGLSSLGSEYEKRKEYYRTRYIQNKKRFADMQRNYHAKNAAIISAKRKIYREKNKDRDLITAKQYRLKNKERLLIKGREYHAKNREVINAKARAGKQKTNDRNKFKYSNNSQFKLKTLLRTRLNLCLKGKIKNGSSVRDLGCTVPELIKYIESKFSLGMSWNNWGRIDKEHTWNLDHIRPLSSFDLTDRKQFLLACHYTNLQPLWSLDNRLKSNKII